MMKLLKKDMTVLFFFVTGVLLYHELVFRFVSKGTINIVDISVLVLFCALIGCVVTWIISLFKTTKRKSVTRLFVLMSCILFSSQVVYYGIFGTIYTFYSFMNGGKAFSFLEVIIVETAQAIIPIVLIFLPFILFSKLLKRNIFENSKRLKVGLILGVLFVIFLNIGLFFVSNDKLGINSKFRLYYKDNNPLEASKRFGLITAMRLDVQHYFGLYKSDPLLSRYYTIQTKETSDSLEHIKKLWQDDVKNHQYDINFNEVKEDVSDPLVIETLSYFDSVDVTTTNEMTGKYKNYNLIYITAESFSEVSAHPLFTPTLWKLQTQGMQFTNFYTPLWGVSTTDGEYTSLLSLYPKSGVWSMLLSQDNDLPFSYGNILKKYGYTTKAFHNHEVGYYGRDKTHPNLGYEFWAKGQGLNITDGWPESDIELFEEGLSKLDPSEKFMAYFLTVSGHFPYDQLRNPIVSKHIDKLKNSGYSDQANAYLATQIELDLALEKLMDWLELNNIEDKTLIVINPDHHPYALKDQAREELRDTPLFTPISQYESSLIIYEPNIKPMVNTKVAGSFDVLPTVLNLLGVDYDDRLIMGRDIFSNSEGFVSFVDRSWISDMGYYNSLENIFYSHSGKEVDPHYVSKMNSMILKRQEVSQRILDLNIYQYLQPYIK